VKESASITANAALEQHVVDLIARDMGDLAEQLEGRRVTLTDKIAVLHTRGKEVRKIGMSVAQRFTNAFADPQVAYILMSFGMLGVAMELYHPGAIFPGVVGTICLVMAFVSFQVMPINWGGLLLLILGFALFIAEAFITSNGLLGVGGGVAVVLGGLLLINTQDPNYFVQPDFALGWTQVLPLGVVIAGIAIFIARAVLSTKLQTRRETGKEGMVGEKARVKEAIGTQLEGSVMVTGELWRATAQESIEEGASVVVVSVNGLTVHVRRST
jgi:membrane-bound serine protease (ClpP class)